MAIVNTSVKLLLILLLMSLCSCSDDAQTTSSNPLVVESYLHVNRPIKVTVSNLAGVSAVDVDHLTITASNDEATILLSATGNGIYTSDSYKVVKEGVGNYTLHFIDNHSREVTSRTVVPTKPVDFVLSDSAISITPISLGTFPPTGATNEGLTLTWSNPDEGYYFTFFENLESNPELINNIQDTTNGNAPRLFFRGEPTQESSGEIRYSQFEYYGKYNVILFHINADYAALYKKQENSSSLNLTSPFTNVVNGLGIFTAIHSDTVVLNVKKP